MTAETTPPTSAEASGVADAPTKKKDKKPPPGLVIPPKRPKMTKAERRALQEQQRAAKAAAQGGKGGKQLQPTPKKHVLAEQQQQKQKQPESKSGSSGDGEKQSKEKANKNDSGNNSQSNRNDCLDLFSHLPQYKEMPDPYAPEYTETLHPDVIELGLKYASGEIQGDNERCRSMMQVFLQVLKDYVLPTTESASSSDASSTSKSNNSKNANDEDFRHHFDHQVLKPSFQFWTVKCRPHSVSMGNAFTFLKTAVASLDRDVSLEDAKSELEETIERYLQERLEYADRAIAQHALTKIHDGDILLTFGHTEAIDVLLRTAHEERIDFYVWVVDARPGADGKKLLQSLREVGIPCGYIRLNALTYVMQQVTKVFVGASALLVNGSIYGTIGTACVALLAKSHHVPVLVCCETYKISNKVQLESITQNELGNPNDLLLLANSNKENGGAGASNSSRQPNLKAANLLYDVTPDKFVSGIITELGIIPPTSVAVLLREMNMSNDRAY
eukprot:CAMPEP_0172359686 /NCGR_PEP_ID=MMETSP1060-20121228/3875_1 /TAXON_ID=37318 /ORGANISM="Pseudo-nitzschia pungens, Strain cf. cingulata" /LENGTH=501 /DNA_ID=CAMNT_0013081465 /DNA_START=180 /DNA_END=1685 /DNA_ORIENTATION=-